MKLTRIFLSVLLISSGTIPGMAQASLTDFHKLMREKAAFDATDLAALERNQPVVRLSRSSDKREVAVSGIVNVKATAQDFLKSYRESMTRTSNAAILEIGSFASEPSPTDVQNLTLEPGDIEDLR